MSKVRFCNDLFSCLGKNFYVGKIWQHATDTTTDRRGHDGPSRVSRTKTLGIVNLSLESESLKSVTDVQDGPSQSRRTVVSTVSEHLDFWEFGIWNNSLTVATDLQDGPSQARRTVTGSVIPVAVRFLAIFKGVFWTIPALIYKVRGLMWLVQFLGGWKTNFE